MIKTFKNRVQKIRKGFRGEKERPTIEVVRWITDRDAKGNLGIISEKNLMTGQYIEHSPPRPINKENFQS